MLRKPLLASARHFPVVTVTGPRQSGKTTLVQATFPRRPYVNLEEPDQRAFAKEDPRGFLSRFRSGVVIDEVQHVPELLSYIQTVADRDRRPGRFILTGSQNLLLLKSIGQSLAGRAAVLHLMPLSYSEIRERAALGWPTFGRRAAPARRITDDDLFELLWRGQYPAVNASSVPAQEWLRNYYRTYVERDVRQLVNVGDLETFGRFVRLCAGRHGSLLNTVALGNDCGVTHSTVRRWLSILEATFVIHLLRPYHRSFNKRLIKAPKLYFLDSGLVCYLLDVRSAAELRTHASRGAVFEGFILAELLKLHWHSGEEPRVFFWRDSAAHEVDFIVERAAAALAIEVKSSQTLAGDAYDGLQFWLRLAGEKARPVLVYGGESQFQRQSVWTYPWSVF